MSDIHYFEGSVEFPIANPREARRSPWWLLWRETKPDVVTVLNPNHQFVDRAPVETVLELGAVPIGRLEITVKVPETTIASLAGMLEARRADVN